MSFDVLNRYSASHKPWDHVGNIIPDIEHSEGERPACEFRVAAWLPVQFYDKYYENWIVTMPGKAVGLDPDGAVIPAQYCGTAPQVVYTTNDIAAGTIDVSTGLACDFTGATKTVELFTMTGVNYSGNTHTLAGTTATYTCGFLGRAGVPWAGANGSSSVTQRYPIGVAPYAYLQWAGGDGSNPSGYHFHNYNMQHQVAVLCDYVIKLPLVPAQATAETVDKVATGSALVIGTANVHTRAYAQANATGRYSATTGTVPVLATYNVVAIALDEYPVAQQTSRTTIAMTSTVAGDLTTVAGLLVNEKTSLAAVVAAGDYWIDYPMGVIFVWSPDGTALPSSMTLCSGTLSITYYHLASAPSTMSKFSCVLAGSIQPGDFLKVGSQSNLVVATAGSDRFVDILGQVLAFETYPRDGLDRVKTAFNPVLNTSAAGSMANGTAGSASAGLGQLDRMPGSADGGMPDLVNYAGAADTLVIINLISR
jgi:hypothetical protein